MYRYVCIILLIGCTNIMMDMQKFENIYQAYGWIKNNIEYKSDGLIDTWQTPEKTYKSLKGDCEDKVILFLYIVKEQFNVEGEMLLTYELEA